MVNDTTYALMAGDAYISNRPYSVNRFPVPAGWTAFYYKIDKSSDFEAVSFQHGNEIGT